mmetsp:Transcript_106960/g.185846  ORF Transcript_106960/g.185846 Transcript_106960/m.185846 type:complete len:242 (+) Transcript_106960:256-981(+)
MITALAVERNMTIRPNSTHDKANTAKCTNFGFILSAPLVNLSQHTLLQPLKTVCGLAHAQREVHIAIKPDIVHLLACECILWLTSWTESLFLGLLQADFGAIHQQCFVWIEAKTLDVEFSNIPVEAVRLVGRDGVELIDLHKGQLTENRLLWLQAIVTDFLFNFGCVPIFQDALDPLDEVFWSFAGRQRANTLWILLDPFQESESCCFAKCWEVINNDSSHALSGSILRIEHAGLNQILLD